MRKSLLIGVFSTVVSAILYGFTPVLVSRIYDMGANAVTVSFLRNLFAIPLAFAWVKLKGGRACLPRQYLPPLLRIGVLGVASTTLLLYSSYAFVEVGTATVLHFLYPLFAAVIGRLFFKEHITIRRAAALVIACGGLSCFLAPGGGSDKQWIGIVMALLSGISYAYYMVSMEKERICLLDVGAVTLHLAAIVALSIFLYGIVTGGMIWNLPLSAWLLSVLVSFCTSFGAVALLQLGVRYLSAGLAAILCLFEPISSIFFGWLLLNENMSASKLLGSAVILGALCLCVTETGKIKRRNDSNDTP